MATGWAVGSSVVLGGALVLGASLLSGPFWLAALFAAGACWAYAIARAAYGSKGGLLALLAYDVVAVGVVTLVASFAAAASGSAWRFAPPALLALVALLTAGALVGELRARRGPAQWSTALGLASPLVLLVAAALV